MFGRISLRLVRRTHLPPSARRFFRFPHGVRHSCAFSTSDNGKPHYLQLAREEPDQLIQQMHDSMRSGNGQLYLSQFDAVHEVSQNLLHNQMYSYAISFNVLSKDLDRAFKLAEEFATLANSQNESDRKPFNQLIDGFLKTKRPDKAEKLAWLLDCIVNQVGFSLAHKRTLKQAIQIQGKRPDRYNELLEIWEYYLGHHIEPSMVDIIFVFDAMYRHGDIDRCFDLYRDTYERGFVPHRSMYPKMASLLIKNGRVHDAISVMDDAAGFAADKAHDGSDNPPEYHSKTARDYGAKFLYFISHNKDYAVRLVQTAEVMNALVERNAFAIKHVDKCLESAFVVGDDEFAQEVLDKVQEFHLDLGKVSKKLQLQILYMKPGRYNLNKRRANEGSLADPDYEAPLILPKEQVEHARTKVLTLVDELLQEGSDITDSVWIGVFRFLELQGHPADSGMQETWDKMIDYYNRTDICNTRVPLQVHLSFLRAFSANNDLRQCRRLYRQFQREGPNGILQNHTKIVNILLQTYFTAERYEDMETIFDSMNEQGLRPNAQTYHIMLRHAGACDRMDRADLLLKQMLIDAEEQKAVGATHANSQETQESKHDLTSEKDHTSSHHSRYGAGILTMDAGVFTALLTGYRDALRRLSDNITKDRVKRRQVREEMSKILVERADEIVGLMKQYDVQPNWIVYNLLLEIRGRAGDLEGVISTFKELESRTMTDPEIVSTVRTRALPSLRASWSLLASAYGGQGLYKEGYQVLCDFRKHYPDLITERMFFNLFHSIVEQSDNPECAVPLLNHMLETGDGFLLSTRMYTSLLSHFARSNETDQFVSLFRQMQETERSLKNIRQPQPSNQEDGEATTPRLTVDALLYSFAILHLFQVGRIKEAASILYQERPVDFGQDSDIQLQVRLWQVFAQRVAENPAILDQAWQLYSHCQENLVGIGVLGERKRVHADTSSRNNNKKKTLIMKLEFRRAMLNVLASAGSSINTQEQEPIMKEVKSIYQSIGDNIPAVRKFMILLSRNFCLDRVGIIYINHGELAPVIDMINTEPDYIPALPLVSRILSHGFSRLPNIESNSSSSSSSSSSLSSSSTSGLPESQVALLELLSQSLETRMRLGIGGIHGKRLKERLPRMLFPRDSNTTNRDVFVDDEKSGDSDQNYLAISLQDALESIEDMVQSRQLQEACNEIETLVDTHGPQVLKMACNRAGRALINLSIQSI